MAPGTRPSSCFHSSWVRIIGFTHSIVGTQIKAMSKINTLTPSMCVVLYQDGDLAQIDNITGNVNWYRTHQIIYNKHNPGRTGTEQLADLTDTFKKINRISKTFALSNVDENDNFFKKISTQHLYTSNKRI